jgi:TonB-dependent receptor
MQSNTNHSRSVKSLLMGTSLLAGMAAMVAVTAVPALAQEEGIETVQVTGYRASLESAAFAKKAAVGFSESVFAEDIGKFPDTNLAEALNRVPGITLSRETDGEGVNISIRGLGTNFTKITLNNAPIAIATTGATDQSNNNREVDLNMFPSELFAQLQVDKSPRAEMIEGGAAGNVNMRTRRPFDNPGFHLTYTAQGMDNSISNGMGGNGALVVSNTWENTSAGSFGVLVGVAGRTTYNFVNGWEAGNSVYVTPNVNTNALCYGAAFPAGGVTGVNAQCDLSGSTVTNGNGAVSFSGTVPTIPGLTLPAGVTAGQAVDAQVIMALNPALGTFDAGGTAAAWNHNAGIMTKLGNAMMPRLARDMYQRGTRDRYNAVASFEWRPTDNVHVFVDMIGGRQFNNIDRSDMDWMVRYGSFLPVGMTLDSNGVLTGGRFYNSQYFLEARQYIEKGDFFSINPGVSWQVTDLLEVNLQANVSRSHFLRDAGLFMVQTPSDGTKYVDYSASGVHPTETTSWALNDPTIWQWGGGRAWVQDEKRYTNTTGVHLDVKYGGSELAVKVGASWDDIGRGIGGMDASTDWAKYACGGGTTSSCNGAAGSKITNADLHNYLQPGPTGWVRADFAKAFSDTNYYQFRQDGLDSTSSRCDEQTNADFSTTTNTGGTSGCYDEKIIALYGQVDGVVPVGGRDLNYDLGLRWVETHQAIRSPSVTTLTLTSPYTYDGAISSRTFTPYVFPVAKHTYQAFLPSLSLVYHVADDFLVRLSASRTINRPNVSKMINVINFSSPDANSASLGNPALKPYFANNIDIGMEYYTGGEGYFSVAAFRKGLSGFFSNKTNTQPFSYMNAFGVTWQSLTDTQRGNIKHAQLCGDQSTYGTGTYSTYNAADAAACANAPVQVTQPINAPGMENINGLEFGYVQPLDFVLEQYGLKGFGFTANLTIVDQTSTGAAPTHALGVAPYTYNLTGYYDNDGIMVRMNYTFTGRTMQNDVASLNSALCLPNTQSTVDGCPIGPNQYSLAYGQADLSSSLKLSKIFGELPSDPELTFSVQNVFNAKQVSYFQYQNTNWSYYNKGQTYLFGLHGSF